MEKFECKTCGKFFSKQYNLMRHNRTAHTAASAAVYDCNHCDETFTTSKQLTDHVRRSHSSRRKLTVNHTVTSSGDSANKVELPFSCNLCDEKFSRSQNLKIHNERKHKNDTSSDKDVMLYVPVSEKSIEDTVIGEPKSLYEIVDSHQRINNKFRATEDVTEIVFSDKTLELAKHGAFLPVLNLVMEDIIKPHRDSNSLLQIVLDSNSLNYPIISGHYIKTNDLDVSEFLNHVESILQSRTDLNMENKFRITVGTVELPEGGRKLKHKDKSTVEEFLKTKKIWDPKNTDNSCCGTCIAAGLLYHENPKKYRKSNWFGHPAQSKELRDKTTQLYDECTIDVNAMCGPDEYVKFQKYLDTNCIQLQIWDRKMFDEQVYGHESVHKKRIHLILNDCHYYWCRTITTYLQCHYCEDCGRSYSQKHNCKTRCGRCHDLQCREKNNSTIKSIQCDSCRYYFYNETCFRLHMDNGTCAKFKRCSRCYKKMVPKKIVETEDTTQSESGDEAEEKIRKLVLECRNCGLVKCRTCKKFCGSGHLCFVDRPELKTLKGDDYNYIFYDFETYTDSEKYHVPMMVCMQHVCSDCINLPDDYTFCSKYGTRSRTFKGQECLNYFCEFLFYSPCNEKATAIAHNGSRYDTLFLLQWLISHGQRPKMVNRGNKIIQLHGAGKNSVKVKDSFLFLSAPLSELPTMMDLGPDTMKGEFPHKFNKPENWNYDGPLPPIECYDTSRRDGEQLIDWYNKHRFDNFNFMNECEKYCQNDVTVLRRACMRFRETILQTDNIDPWYCSSTIASMCKQIYTSNHLPDNAAIGIAPIKGYCSKQTQSVLAIQYMDWLNMKYDSQIKHAGNQHLEGHVLYYNIDGVYGNDEKHLIEINGCRIHGCPKCTPDGDITQALYGDRTMTECYLDHCRKVEKLRSVGYRVDVVWEHEIYEEIYSNPEMKKFFARVSKNTPISPRDGLYGGRTETFNLLTELSTIQIEDGWGVYYYDYCSLYPTVQQKYLYPMGHPRIINDMHLPQGDDFTLDYLRNNLFGALKVTILPPTDLLIPVLPAHTGSKLTFSLCHACATTNQIEKCEHSDRDRAFTGVWMTPEIDLALQNGYKVIYAHQCLHWDNKTDLFSGYVRRYIQLKAEASGWTSHPCKSSNCHVKNNSCDECKLCIGARRDYIDLYKIKCGVVIDENNVRYNAALRTCCKQILNSLWGKMCQSVDTTKTIFVTSLAQFHKVMREKQVLSIIHASPGVLVLDIKDEIDSNNFYNPYVGSFVTTYARIELYKILKPRMKSMKYCDTDSVIFAAAPTDKLPKSGNLLGDLQDELSGTIITKFVSSGPKSYSYVTSDGKVQTKVKGLRLAFRLGDFINFDTMKAVALQGLNPDDAELDLASAYKKILDRQLRTQLQSTHVAGGNSIAVPDPNFIKNRKDGTIRSDDSRIKYFRLVFDKRIVCTDYSTVPYGYRRHYTPIKFLL